ncbi:hypothetical protein D3C78_885000 [compost metagenome]
MASITMFLASFLFAELPKMAFVSAFTLSTKVRCDLSSSVRLSSVISAMRYSSNLSSNVLQVTTVSAFR